MAIKVENMLLLAAILALFSIAASAQGGFSPASPTSSPPSQSFTDYPNAFGLNHPATGGCPPCMIGKGGQCVNTSPSVGPPSPILSSNSSDYEIMMAIREALPTLASLPGFQGDNPCTWSYAEYQELVFCGSVDGSADGAVRVTGLSFYGGYGVSDNLELNVPFPLDLVAGLDALSSISIADSGPNGFTGELPETWAGAFEDLMSITLSNNSFSGSIPESWAADGAFPALTYVDLGSNNLFGALPQWGNASVPNLDSIILPNNGFSSTLPQSWVSLASLSVVDISVNSLTGTLPEIYGNPDSFGQLANINISQNSFTGTLPESWGGSLAFRRRSLDANFTAESLSLVLNNNPGLTGSIPAAWNESGLLTYAQTVTVYAAPGTSLCGSTPPYVIALSQDLNATDPISDSGADFIRASLPDCAIMPSAPTSG